jgi:hypothetical protein
MPFADPQQRKTYHNRYMKKYRKNPSSKSGKLLMIESDI